VYAHYQINYNFFISRSIKNDALTKTIEMIESYWKRKNWI